MNCHVARRRMSSYLDGELPAAQAEALVAHQASCAACRERLASLRAASASLASLSRLAAPDALAARVLSRIEAENYRGPSLSFMYRSPWAARPLLLPSLVPAVVALLVTVGAAVAMDSGPAELPQMATMTVGEWNTAPASSSPLISTSTVGLPKRREGGPSNRESLAMAEGSLFIQTVVATDGTVSEVNVLDGNQELGMPLRDALWAERFEPMRYRGRPVAVSVYRLFSRMDVRAPVT